MLVAAVATASTSGETPLRVVTQAFDGRKQVARSFTHKGRCSDLEGSLLDVGIVHRREHDDLRFWVDLRDQTTRLQSVDVGQVDVDHNDVRLESSRGVHHGVAVSDVAYDVAVQRQHAANGFRHSWVVFGDQDAGPRGQELISSVMRHSAGLTGSRVLRCGAG
jgi:hypothetical protein